MKQWYIGFICVVAFAAASIVVGIDLLGRGGTHSTARAAAPSTPMTASAPSTVPANYLPFEGDVIQVVDSAGRKVGTISKAQLYSSAGAPIAVHDAAGNRVGQFFSGQLGFVPNVIADDAATLNNLRQCMSSFVSLEAGSGTGGTTKLSSSCVQLLTSDDVPVPTSIRP
jgi:hypothetical protein